MTSIFDYLEEPQIETLAVLKYEQILKELNTEKVKLQSRIEMIDWAIQHIDWGLTKKELREVYRYLKRQKELSK